MAINPSNIVGSFGKTSPQKKVTDNTIDVFVYGSLRSGGALDTTMFAGTYIGTKQTKPSYTMYDLGAFPCITKGGDTAITVEHYVVSRLMLKTLDRIESHPNMYKRVKITLDDKSKGFIYLWNREVLTSRPVVESGDWLEYLKESRN